MLIHERIFRKCISLEKILPCKPDLEKQNYFGLTALIKAITDDSIENVKMLLEAGAIVNYVGQCMDVLVYTINYNSRPQMIDLILDYGVS